MIKSQSKFRLLVTSTLVLLSVVSNPLVSHASTFTAPLPSISSGSTVGGLLTVNVGAWSPTPDSFSYQWKRNGVAITGANDSSYRVRGGDLFSYITVAVTGTKTGITTLTREPSSFSSGNYISTRGTFSITPSFSGANRVGEFLSAALGNVPAEATISYQWLRGSFSIAGATSAQYQLMPSDEGLQISVMITASGVGWDTLRVTSQRSAPILPARPKATWVSPTAVLTGKNSISVSGTLAFLSTSRLEVWCFFLNGSPMPLNSKISGGASFFASSRSVDATKRGSSCFKSQSGPNLASVHVDVTQWALGTNRLGVVVYDARGVASELSEIEVTVGKTAPTVVLNSSSATLSGEAIVEFTTTTHSPSAPVHVLCVLVDGKRFVPTAFSVEGLTQQRVNAEVVQKGELKNCIKATKLRNISKAFISIDTEMFPNGNREIAFQAISNDGTSSWSSDLAILTATFNNAFVPKIVWSQQSQAPTMIGRSAQITGSVRANIPGAPSAIVVSMKNENGEWVELKRFLSQNSFSTRISLKSDVDIQVQVFDAANSLVLTEIKKMQISPFFSVSRPSVVVTGSTLSKNKTKSVAFTISSGKPAGSKCTAKWSAGGRTGSKNFRLGTSVRYSFSTPNSPGVFTVLCTAKGMQPRSPAFSSSF